MPAPDLLIPIDAAFLAELTARTALETGDIHWKIEIDPDGLGFDDYTSYLENNQVEIRGASSSIFKPCEAANASFRIKNSPKIHSEGDLARCQIKISVKIGASGYIQIFTGYVSDRGCQREKRNLTHDKLTITAQDPAAYRGLKKKVKNQALLNYKICDTGTPAASIAHHLATQMGHVVGDLEFIDILQTKDYVGLDGRASAFAELQDLAIQHGVYLGYRYDGKLRLIVWTAVEWAALVPEYTFDHTNVHEWNAIGGEVICNKAKTEFMQYQVLPAGGIIYKNYDDWDETLLQNAIVVAAGEYWPGETDSLAVGRLNYGYGQEKYPIGINIIEPTIGNVGSGSDIQCSGGLLTLISFNGSTGDTMQNVDSSEIILRNNTGSDITIVGFQVRGTPVREKAMIKVEHVDAAVVNEWEEVERELPGKYATSSTQAKVTVRRWVDFGKAARKRFEVLADFTPHVQTGAVIHFHPNADVELDCFIEEYSHTSRGPHTKTQTRLTLVERVDYNATGAGGVVHDTPTVPPEVVPPASIDNPLLIDTNVIGTEHMRSGNDVYGPDDELPASAELFDLSQPDCQSHSGRKPEPGFLTCFRPAKIGQEDNVNLNWTGRGTVGFWKAATQLLTYPEDWTDYAVERMATNPALEYLLEVEKQCTKLTFAADAGKYKEYVQKRAIGLGNSAQYIFSALIYSAGAQTLYSKVDDELLDRGDCESVGAPIIFGETANYSGNASYARSNVQAYENTYSGLVTKTVAAGSTGYYGFCDAVNFADKHGLIDGQTYTLEFELYIPAASGILGTEVLIEIQDYLGAWQATTQAAVNTYDAWQKVTVTRALRAGATGIYFGIQLASAAALNEYCYIDLVKMRSNSEGACKSHSLVAGLNQIEFSKICSLRAAVYLSNHDIDAGGAGAAYSCYVLNSQFETGKYTTPYTPQGRVLASSLWYYYAWAQLGAIEGWFRPGFTYDVATDKYIFSDHSGANVKIRLFYQAADDKFTFIITDGATTITLQSGVIGGADDDAKNANLRQWTWFKVFWNTTTDSYALLLKSAYFDVNTTSATALNTITFSQILNIGGIPKATTPATYEWDGDITDLLIYDTKDTATGHYAVDRPWFDPNELANEERSVRINRDGIRLHNTSLIITDKYNRQINISNSDGMLARDGNGSIIHDIQDSILMVNQKYFGHVYDLNYPGLVGSYTNASGTGIKNISLSSMIGSAKNIKGALLYIESWIYDVNYANNIWVIESLINYNDSSAKRARYKHCFYQTESFGSSTVWSCQSGTIFVPVFWVAGVPYISIWVDFSLGSASSALYIELAGLLT